MMTLVMGLFSFGVLASEQSVEEKKNVEVVFTHDLHSHLESFMTEDEGQVKSLGGFARIQSFVKEKRAQADDLLVVDAGDFSMGTLYQTIFESEAVELRLLGMMGYDATTLGNHEFDYHTEGLIQMTQSALEKGDKLSPMVVCNIDWEKSLVGENTALNSELKTVFEAYGVKPYIMTEKNGVRIAITGVFGKESLKFSPTCTLNFKDPIEAVKETVAQIKANEQADMIVCLSHSGTWADIEKSEDDILAMEVPELDLIVSGHTHTKLEEPIIHGNTAIVSCGEYGKYVGSLTMLPTKEGRWQVENYKLVAIDETIKEDEGVKKQVESFGSQINASYLGQFGYTKDEVLAYNPWSYPTLKEMSSKVQEQPFANLLADAYLYTMEQIGQKQEDEVMLAVVPMGVIRDTFASNKQITVSNVYDTFSLGIGEDGIPGYPMIRIYLTGKEIKLATEIDASLSKLMTTAQLFISGLSYEINPNRILLNKVTKVELMNQAGERSELEDSKLYPIVTDLYSGQMLGSVTDLSYGLISIVPKKADGTPINHLSDAIVYHEGKEVKAWTAIADYMKSFKIGDEVSSIPSYYGGPQDRKVIVDDDRLGAILSNPNGLILKVAGILMGVLVVIILLVIGIIKVIKMIIKGRRKQATL
ncbi:MAG: bifunctional metallophosphatase/5'-nucleotidase [Cellulosilyticum sp.]|nr:bifunctional metallophosphatase/5'-nucleotidase [Cellulosilyticum sp.]